MNPLVLPLSTFRRKVHLNFQSPKPGSLAILWSHLNEEWFAPFLNEYGFANPAPQELRFEIEVDPQGDLYIVSLAGHIKPKLECSRSLTPFDSELTLSDKCFFVEQDQEEPQSIHQDSERALMTYEIQGEHLNLKEFLLDALYGCIPERPLCRPDCKGLCEECGQNLNELFLCSRPECPKESAILQ